MIRPTIRPAALSALAAATVLSLVPAAPLAAQQTFELPPAVPTPTPTPAGPADERGGVAIPPRSQPEPIPEITAAPVIQPLPSPSASRTPVPRPSSPASAPSTTATGPSPTPSVTPTPSAAPAPTEQADIPAAPSPSIMAGAPPLTPPPEAQLETTGSQDELPAWWPYAAGGLGAAVLLGGALLWRRRRKPGMLRLAGPTAIGQRKGEPRAATEPARLDLTLEITSATRSVMMFTIGYRLTIANRSERAVSDLNAAVQLACARASGGSGPSAGAAQALETIARIGPHQARSVTGTVQLPLSAIQPLRQEQTPLFIPLAHVTLEGGGQAAIARSFVIGSRSASGRVHPIPLDQPPGGIAGLVAQAVAIPAASAA